MSNLDIDPIFINIHLKEEIEICTNELFKNNGIINGLKKKSI